MAQINKPTDYFNTKLYTGTGVETAITGVGFQPDWIWFKARSSAYYHGLFDVIRGTEQRLVTNTSDAESTKSSALTSFDSDGFTLGADVSNTTNASGQTFVAWNWLAGGTASSNTDGSITSTVSANTTSGFSIVKYTGNGTGGSTIGHGLGSVPSTILLKPLDRTDNWRVYHKGIDATAPEDYHLKLQDTSARADSTDIWNDTAPTSSVFTLGANAGVVANGEDFIAYCFAEKKGFSKFGSYTGNGNADGTFVYTGFKPAWVMWKKSSSTSSWWIGDSTRDVDNVVQQELFADTSSAENTESGGRVDFLSNGFKHRNSGGTGNTSGATYIYMAFAESPLVGTNNIPATAR